MWLIDDDLVVLHSYSIQRYSRQQFYSDGWCLELCYARCMRSFPMLRVRLPVSNLSEQGIYPTIIVIIVALQRTQQDILMPARYANAGPLDTMRFRPRGEGGETMNTEGV